MKGWDIVVVGAGASGSALARTLSDAGMRVLLLEAGPAPTTAPAPDAYSLIGASPEHRLAWSASASLTDTRAHVIVRGRGLGGSTATNGCYFRRARNHDLERWALRVDDDRWHPRATIDVWRALETDYDFGSSPGHGAEGPISVTRASVHNPLAAMFLQAGSDLGLPIELDKNAEGDPGVGPTPMNAVNGMRVDARVAFLREATSALSIWTDATAVGLEWAVGDSATVVGVRVRRSGSEQTILAGEVILCAGAIATAQLLQISGVGPSEVLLAAGIRVRCDLPVGLAFSDHPNLVLNYTLATGGWPFEDHPTLGVSAHGSSGVLEADGATSVPGDIEVLSFHRPLARMLGVQPESDTLSVLCSPLVSSGLGTVRIIDGTIDRRPRLHFHYRESPEERARMRAAVRLGANMLSSEAARNFGVTPQGWHRGVMENDSSLDEWIDARLSTALHTCGTTPMGRPGDPRAVVDGEGRVHGVSGLRVADTGILPDTPTGGPAATAALIGVVVARAILDA